MSQVGSHTQFKTRGTAAVAPVSLALVDSGLGYWTIQTGTAGAYFTDSGAGYVIVDATASRGMTIKRVGSMPVRILS